MLTNNFYVMSAVQYFGAQIKNKAVKPDGTIVTVYGGNMVYNYTPSPIITTSAFRSNYDGFGIIVGSGNTPAAKTDYKLDNIISSGLKQSSKTYAFNSLDDGDEVVYAVILQNTSDADITISEIGLLSQAFTSGSSNAVMYLLVDRTVLDAPITIPAGETKTISYAIRINYPD